MKNVFSGALLAAAALSIGLSGTAKADSIAADLMLPLAPSGTAISLINLSGISTPSQAGIIGPDYTISFSTEASQGVVHGGVSTSHAIPVAGVTGTTPEYLTGDYGSSLTTDPAASGNYFSTALGIITITFATPKTSFALLWGSVDTSNSLGFNDAGNFLVTGSDVQAAAAGFVSNGFQGPGGSAYVVVNTDTPFTTVTATSNLVSFEFAGVAANTAGFTATPEPASIALFGLGIGVLALVAFRRRDGARQS
ncbi:MAG: Npun_F0296 family exosortase-dependent surface protein [Bryobacteraceae bacterium]